MAFNIEYMFKLRTREHKDCEFIEEKDEELGGGGKEGLQGANMRLEEDSEEEVVVPSKCDEELPNLRKNLQ